MSKIITTYDIKERIDKINATVEEIAAVMSKYQIVKSDAPTTDRVSTLESKCNILKPALNEANLINLLTWSRSMRHDFNEMNADLTFMEKLALELLESNANGSAIFERYKKSTKKDW